MPTGGFLSDQLSTRGSGFVSGSGGMTGTGAPSNPRWNMDAPAPASGSTTMTNAGPRYSSPGTDYGQTSAAGGFGAFSSIQNGPLPPGTPTGLYGVPGSASSLMAPSPLSGIQSLVNGIYGPQQTILAQQLARQQDQLGMVGMDVDYKTSALNRDYALSLQALGIDREALGLDKSLASGQLGNLSRLRDILASRRGIATDVKSNTLTGLQIDEDKARDMAGRQTFDLRSDLTARGAFNTIANERGTGRIQRDLGYNLRGVNNQRDAADITYRNTLLGLNEQGIGYDNQALALNNKLAGIGLDARRLDISEEQLENGLADGLHNVGMAGMVSINGLLDAMGGTNTQQAAMATEIMNAVLAYSNLPPEVLKQIQAMMGTGTTQHGVGQAGQHQYPYGQTG